LESQFAASYTVSFFPAQSAASDSSVDVASQPSRSVKPPVRVASIETVPSPVRVVDEAPDESANDVKRKFRIGSGRVYSRDQLRQLEEQESEEQQDDSFEAEHTEPVSESTYTSFASLPLASQPVFSVTTTGVSSEVALPESSNASVVDQMEEISVALPAAPEPLTLRLTELPPNVCETNGKQLLDRQNQVCKELTLFILVCLSAFRAGSVYFNNCIN
jgi:hypothetical protein